MIKVHVNAFLSVAEISEYTGVIFISGEAGIKTIVFLSFSAVSVCSVRNQFINLIGTSAGVSIFIFGSIFRFNKC